MKMFFCRYWAYFAATLVFLAVIFFFAKVTVFDLQRTKIEIARMRAEQDAYRRQAEADSIFIESLNDDEFLEKFAREKFYMKRAGEEIYVVEE